MYIKECIARLGVPLFFIISGVLFFRNYDNSMYFKKIKSRFKSLFIPYIVWNTLCMLFSIITSYSFISNYFIGREKFIITLPNVIDAILNHGCNIPFWFIQELIILILLSPILYYIIKNKYIGISIISAIFILQGSGCVIPLVSSGIFPFLLGGLIGRHFFDAFSKKSSFKWQIFGGSAIVVSSIVICFKTFNLFIIPSFVYYALIYISAVSFWLFADLFIDKLKNRQFYSSSFLVFAMHVNVSAVVTKLLYFILPKSSYFAFLNCALTIIISLFLINIFGIILKRFLPKIYSVLTGAR